MQRLGVALFSAVIVTGCGGLESTQDPTSTSTATSSSDLVTADAAPDGRGNSAREHGKKEESRQGGSSTVISYHGGPVLLGTTRVYYIWYGNWSGNTAGTILEDFANSVGGSPYFNINTTYWNGAGTHVSNSVAFGGSTTDNYSFGTSLSDAQIRSVVNSAISSARLPKDTNGVYFVLTSSDVGASSGFCTVYCGWHTRASIGGSDIKYAFVGNPDRCPAACAAQTVGPNGNAGADGMASVIAHELDEAVTDPDLNAWYDRRGAENADKCAWTFGTPFTTGNGALANVTLGTRSYLIQQNWVNSGAGRCAMSY